MRHSLHTPACRLNVANIKSLISILEEGMGNKKSLSLSFELNGSELSFGNLDELIKHADTPPTLYSLVLSVNDWKSNKRTFVCFYDDGPPFILVEGKDEAWVIGKCKQIEKFLINKKAKFSFLFGDKLFYLLFIFMLISTIYNFGSLPGVGLFSSSITFYSLKVDKLLSLIALLSPILFISLSLLKSKPKFLYPYTKIKLEEGRDINTKINLGMLIVTIVGVFVAIVSYILNK